MGQTAMAGPVSASTLAAALGLPSPTPEQRAVIEAPLHSMLVVAGAGSGKTETMASRVVWLAVNGLVEPQAVLGLTFTRKAARELRDRVVRRLGAVRATAGAVVPPEEADPEPDIQTYHAYAASLLAEFGMLAGLEPGARLLSAAGSWQLAHHIVTAYDGPMDDVDVAASSVTRAVLSLGDELSEQLCDVDRALAWSDEFSTRLTTLPGGRVPVPIRRMRDRARARRQILGVVQDYRRAKERLGCLDFSDQLAMAARLVQEHPWIADRERQRRGLVLLDEFQDTSAAQLELLRCLFGPQASGQDPPMPVVAVGDPHQSIYGWRGAGADTLGRFAGAFAPGGEDGPSAGAGLSCVPLSTSWRNGVQILAVANRVAQPLAAAGVVPVRRLVPAPGAPTGRVEVARCADEAAEASMVADWIVAARADVAAAGGERGDSEDVSAAVLCRRHEQIPVVAAALRARGVEVEEVGVGGLLTTPEVEYLVAALTAAHDPRRNDATLQLLMRAPVFLGAADLDAVGAWAAEVSRRATQTDGTGRQRSRGASLDPDTDEPSLAEAVTRLPPRGWRSASGQRLSDGARRRLRMLGGMILRIASLQGLPLPDVVYAAERILGLDVEVASREPHAAGLGRHHLRRFAEVMADYAASTQSRSMTAAIDWLDAARVEEAGLKVDAPPARIGSVQVLTVHAAKGLEWDVVAVPGLVEGVFPAVRVGASRWREGVWWAGSARDPGWTTQVGALPYDLRSDRSALPALAWDRAEDVDSLKRSLETFEAAQAEHRLNEERRLMYVAATRARRSLLMTAHVWGGGATPRVTSRFLEEIREFSHLEEIREFSHLEVAPSGSPQSGLREPDGIRVLRWEGMPQPPEDPAHEQPATHVLAEPSHSPTPAGNDGVGSADPGPLADRTAVWPSPVRGDPRWARAAEHVRGWQNRSVRRDDVTVEDRAFAPIDQHIAVLMAERDRAVRSRGSARANGPALTRGTRGADNQEIGERLPIPTPLTASELVRRRRDPLAESHDARRPMPRRPLPGGPVGRAWHRWVEAYYRHGQLFGLDPADRLRSSHGLSGEGPGSDEGVEGVEAVLARMRIAGVAVSDELVTSHMAEAFITGPWATRRPVAIELPVETVVGGVPLRGRIDAVFSDGEDRYVVVDWKTGRPPTGTAGQAQTMQLAMYRTAYARLVGVPVEHVRACFYYVDSGVTTFPPLPGEEAFLALVESVSRW